MLIKIYKEGEILGLENIFYKIPFNFTAKVKTDKLKIFNTNGRFKFK